MRSYECRKFLNVYLVKVINHAVVCVCVLVQLYFSITIQQICMKFGVVITPNSGCLVLCRWSSFGFGIGNVLVSRFCPPFVKVVSHHALVYGLSIAPQLSGE